MSESVLPNNQGGPFYPQQYAQFSPTAGNAEVFYLQPAVAFRPGSLILSNPSNTKVEVTNSAPNELASTDTALWTTLTSAALVGLNFPFTAIRVTNTGGSGTIVAELAM